MIQKNKLIILYGPTGVGKTDISLMLNTVSSIEVINGDVGQFYKPLSIGTAKPDWREEIIPHHLFDICTDPIDMTVVQYRALVIEKMQEIWHRGNIPVLVGGSGFYIQSLFFPPLQINQVQQNKLIESYHNQTTEDLWHLLQQKDSKRAQEINKYDNYRIIRALQILDQGQQASHQKPFYQALPADVLLLFLVRPRVELYQRINERVKNMMDMGWIQEVQSIMNTEWESFLLQKKLIGYNDIINYIHGKNTSQASYDHLIGIIQQKTRHYAKRQCTFWRMLSKKLVGHFNMPSYIEEVDLHSKTVTLISKVEHFLKERDE